MKFTIDKSKKTQIEVTDSWESTTLNQYIRILNLKDDMIEVISIITGLEYDYLKKAKIKGIAKLLFAAKFINTKWEPPSKLTHIGPYELPLNSDGTFDIQFESLAQFEDMRQIMASTQPGVKEIVDSYAKYCSIYLQKIRDGEYDYDKAQKMLPEIYTLPAIQVITAGSFFLIGLSHLLNGTEPNFRNKTQPQKKATGKNIKKRSVSRPRSTRQAKR